MQLINCNARVLRTSARPQRQRRGLVIFAFKEDPVPKDRAERAKRLGRVNLCISSEHRHGQLTLLVRAVPTWGKRGPLTSVESSGKAPGRFPMP